MKGAVDWVDTEVELPVTTAKPGPLTLTAPQRGILEAYDRPDTNQLTLMMSSQIGKSMLMLVIMGWHMAEYPTQIMLVQATRDSMRRFMVEKLWPLVASNPTLSSKVDPRVINTFAPTIIDYTDGMVFTAWSGSKAMMRSTTAELVIADEVDIYEPTADYSDPLDMLRQRGTTFGSSRKLVIASTPIDADESLVKREYDRGSQCVWMVPCPHCELKHELIWESVRGGNLYCPGCGVWIEEGDRLRAVENGEWVENGGKGPVVEGGPHNPNQSFHLSQLYSQFVTLETTASILKSDQSNIRSFTTQVLALGYETKVKLESASDHVDLLFTSSTKDPRITALTMAVDVQKNRLEYQIIRWDGLLPRIHQHSIITNGGWDQWWGALADVIRRINPDMTFIDRGYRTTDVRSAVSKHLARESLMEKVRLIRGSSSPDYVAGDLVQRGPGWKIRPLDLELNTNAGKEMLHDMIVGHGISFNVDMVPIDFASQITSEELKMVTRGQREVPRWVKRHSRAKNEALDCAVYNICARYSLGVEYRRVYNEDKLRGELKEIIA